MDGSNARVNTQRVFRRASATPRRIPQACAVSMLLAAAATKHAALANGHRALQSFDAAVGLATPNKPEGADRAWLERIGCGKQGAAKIGLWK